MKAHEKVYGADPEVVGDNETLTAAVPGPGFVGPPKPDAVLTLLYPQEHIRIESTTGKEMLAHAHSIFPRWVDGDFGRREETNVESRSTKAAEVSVLRLDSNANSVHVCGALQHSKQGRYLTQGQIMSFAKLHHNRLHPQGFETLFPFSKEFVAVVSGLGKDALQVRLCRSTTPRVWMKAKEHRVVVLK